jgi:plastocyanin
MCALAVGPACNMLFGLDDLEAVEGGGTGAAGGAGPCVPLQCPYTECLSAACEGNECATIPLPEGTPCMQSDGTVCNGVGACVECVANEDCDSGICAGQICLPVACTNGDKDGTETDVDCGGGCDPCSPNKTCASASDCLSGVCTGMKCQSPTCVDGVKNGSETDIDCGSTCAGCVGGKDCITDDDCESMICDVDTCVLPTCSDGVENGGETDLDCGGPCSGCAEGKACVDLEDCESEICTASVCVLLNGCALSTAVDFTAASTVNIGFTAVEYNPPCFKVKAGTEVTFQGAFTGHDFWGGAIVDDIELPDATSPFMPPTTTGQSATFILTAPGNYGFYCEPHWDVGMKGAAFVVP